MENPEYDHHEQLELPLTYPTGDVGFYPNGLEPGFPLQVPGREPEEPRILSPKEHGQLLHKGGSGTVALATNQGNYREIIRPVEAAIEELNLCRDRHNVYLSVHRFRGRRRIAHLLSMGALYADLDYYRLPEYAGESPGRVLERALRLLGRARMPEPSIAISSGRGLYLFWLHSPIPREALPRWNACQRELHRTLAPLGSDPMTLDAARVLRVVGTRHSKSGALVEAITPTGRVETFDGLADRILPVSRADLADLRVQRALRATHRPAEGRPAPPEGFTPATLWEARLSDLQRLREIRWFGDLPPGHRDGWMFVAGVAMSWLCEPVVLQRELHALAREAASWSEREAKSRMAAVFRTSREAAAGKKVEFGGAEWDPRYRLKNQTIIEALQITAEEEREMRTIISDDERRRRDRQRKEPEMTREEYEGRAADRRTQARRMRAEGLSVPEIARRLRVSKESIRSYLYRR